MAVLRQGWGRAARSCLLELPKNNINLSERRPNYCVFLALRYPVIPSHFLPNYPSMPVFKINVSPHLNDFQYVHLLLPPTVLY